MKNMKGIHVKILATENHSNVNDFGRYGFSFLPKYFLSVNERNKVRIFAKFKSDNLDSSVLV